MNDCKDCQLAPMNLYCVDCKHYIEKPSFYCKPCPFCGNTELRWDYNEFWIECEKCYVIIYGSSQEQTIKKWNKRIG